MGSLEDTPLAVKLLDLENRLYIIDSGGTYCCSLNILTLTYLSGQLDIELESKQPERTNLAGSVHLIQQHKN